MINFQKLSLSRPVGAKPQELANIRSIEQTINNVLSQTVNSLSEIVDTGAYGKVKVASTSTAQFLENILTAGANITITKSVSSNNDILTIASTASGGTDLGQVLYWERA